MKIFRNGSHFEFEECESNVFYIKVDVSPPRQNEFAKVQAMIDTGCSSVLIPKKILDEVQGVFPPVGAEEAETANGVVKEAVTEIDLRLKTTSGEIVLIKGVKASVSNSCEEVILGMSVLKYFSLLFKKGALVDFRFDEKSVG